MTRNFLSSFKNILQSLIKESSTFTIKILRKIYEKPLLENWQLKIKSIAKKTDCVIYCFKSRINRTEKNNRNGFWLEMG